MHFCHKTYRHRCWPYCWLLVKGWQLLYYCSQRSLVSFLRWFPPQPTDALKKEVIWTCCCEKKTISGVADDRHNGTITTRTLFLIGNLQRIIKLSRLWHYYVSIVIPTLLCLSFSFLGFLGENRMRWERESINHMANLSGMKNQVVWWGVVVLWGGRARRVIKNHTVARTTFPTHTRGITQQKRKGERRRDPGGV